MLSTFINSTQCTMYMNAYEGETFPLSFSFILPSLAPLMPRRGNGKRRMTLLSIQPGEKELKNYRGRKEEEEEQERKKINKDLVKKVVTDKGKR